MNDTSGLAVSRVSPRTDIVCFAHLRWDFVFQRPQHLMTRFAREHRVFYLEEPFVDSANDHIEVLERGENLSILQPHLSSKLDARQLSRLIHDKLSELGCEDFVAWFYTPMMLELLGEMRPAAIVFDCMDELSAFKDAPPELLAKEAELLRAADVVFTGGQSLYEAKRDRHPNAHPFPSSVDVTHFAKAREISQETSEQASLPRPRIGFAGVIDERLDVELLNKIAELRPEFQFVMIGPVVKISEDDLPRRDNIHYLGMKAYDDLPAYMAGWDVAMMPFALNESTRFISPTKTPEYLSAGLPVVSTAIRDVVRPYGKRGLVHIAATASEFVDAIETALKKERDQGEIDRFLNENSWDATYLRMSSLINEAISINAVGPGTEKISINNTRGNECTTI